ncbi:dihydrofolate reductase family protein [Nocardioides nematodiphilus]|uniref:dihydrofolate reductase family protein n=1 Tax=Nocardioides nematodiphilus TaxID=2849669 RepID=UPI001CD965AD|nr:dihydrofolate reductase family protein [Nocardioides nematodiphilus]MCA1984653.1 dihydrofolate reductase family protein [Nocardioides nematodiphilus]
MRRLTYAMGVSLDGYAMGPDGRFDWSVPDEEVFDHALQQVRGLSVHLLGRRLYETMLFWEGAEENPELDDAEREFALVWQALPKVVFSRSLTSVEGSNTRLATRPLAEEIVALREGAEGGDGDIAIGGPELAHEAAALGLIDEYAPRIHPTLLGGGTPYFAPGGPQVDLELVESRTCASGVLLQRHRVRR